VCIVFPVFLFIIVSRIYILAYLDMAESKSMFNSEWMDKTLNPDFSSCIKRVPSNRFQAHCSVCHKNFELSSMGRGAVVSTSYEECFAYEEYCRRQ